MAFPECILDVTCQFCRTGLVRVWIFYRKDDPRNYAYSLSERGPRLTGYTWLSARPPLGELRYIDLYNR